jgi:hypothetical protein
VNGGNFPPLLDNLLLILVDELYGEAAVSHEVLSVTVAAVSHAVRFDYLLGLLDRLRLHFGVRTANLRPAPFLDGCLDQLLLHNTDDFLAHLLTLANIWSSEDSFRQRVY